METSKMKNMVVLKNLPSNIVEEAIIILKSNTKKRNLQKIENNNNCVNTEQNKKNKDFILKEAEMLVNDYALKIENKKAFFNKKKNKKYQRLKRYAIIATIANIIQLLIIIL